MVWKIEYTDAFLVWWNELSEAEQNAISISVEVLQRAGPNLTRPHVDTVNGSRHSNMKELRTQHRGNLIARSLPSILAERPCCSLAGIKLGMIGFTIR